MKRIISLLGEILLWVIAFLSVLFCLWFLISFLDVISHNIALREGYGDYLDWNLFSIVIDMIN